MENSPTSELRQYAVTGVVSLSLVNFGLVAGWMSPVVPLLRSKLNPAIGGAPLSDDMIALAGALAYCGTAIGCFFWASVANKLGRKRTLILIMLPYVLSWSLLCFSNNRFTLYTARLIGGLGNAGSLINSPMYVAEICTARLRDRLVPLLVVSMCGGILLVYLLGWLLPFQVMNFVNLVTAVLALLFSCYIPESPVYYLKCNQLREAKQSLTWLRNYQQENEKHSLKLEMDLQVLESSFLNKESLTPWRDLMIPSTRKALLIGLGLAAFQHLSGITVIAVYIVYILKSVDVEASLLTPHVASLILAVMSLVAALGSVHLVKNFQRKSFLLVNNFLMALSLLVLGIFYYLASVEFPHLSYFSLVPVVFFSLHSGAFIMASPAYLIISSEMFPAETRNVCMGLVLIFQNLLAFSLVRLFPFMNSHLGLHGCIWTYAAFVLTGIIFLHVFLPETKNKSFKEIVSKLNNEQPLA